MFDFSEFPTIETERCLLRQMTHDDAPAILKHLGNPKVKQYLNMETLQDIDGAVAWIDWMNRYYEEQDGLRWGITLKSTGDFVGSVGLHGWDSTVRFAEVGYDLSEPFWGQGYATEVTQRVIQFGWEEMNLQRIEADVVSENDGSVRVLEKLGFQYEGTRQRRVLLGDTYHDELLYALLKTPMS